MYYLDEGNISHTEKFKDQLNTETPLKANIRGKICGVTCILRSHNIPEWEITSCMWELGDRAGIILQNRAKWWVWYLLPTQIWQVLWNILGEWEASSLTKYKENTSILGKWKTVYTIYIEMIMPKLLSELKLRGNKNENKWSLSQTFL